MQPQIEQLAERPDWLPVVADWIYNEWWTDVEGANVGTLTDLLRNHRVHDAIPLTLVASSERGPIGTATLLAHDVGTESWQELSPWLAALYVMPEYRRHGVGRALVRAIEAKAAALGVRELYLATASREEFYVHLGWRVIDRTEETTVMSKVMGQAP